MYFLQQSEQKAFYLERLLRVKQRPRKLHQPLFGEGLLRGLLVAGVSPIIL